MDFVKQIVNEKGGEIIQRLTSQLGFSQEQAQSFVPAAIQQVLSLVQGGKLDVSALLSGGNAAEVVSKVDTQGLASEAGIAADKAASGLESLIPTLTSALNEKAGGAAGLLSLLGGEGAGGILGSVGKLAGGLFKK